MSESLDNIHYLMDDPYMVELRWKKATRGHSHSQILTICTSDGIRWQRSLKCPDWKDPSKRLMFVKDAMKDIRLARSGLNVEWVTRASRSEKKG